MSTEKAPGLAEAMRAVFDPDTPRETIEYLPYDRIDPDPDNFYSLDGLNELADSIAVVGLIDPIRVRVNGERFTVTSGHRRRAAIRILIDGGDARWKDAVPCIVDRGETTPEMAELKLIYANSASRRLTSSEISKQAERVEALLVALKEKGYDFPGRMQDHVAQAMNTSASKLKRVHAIRSNLDPKLLELYDGGKLNESAAYEMQKLPAEVQEYLAPRKKTAEATGYNVGECVKHAELYLHPTCTCPDGSACSHTLPRFYQTATAGMAYWHCGGGCCLKCLRSESECPYQCKLSKQKIEADRVKRREEAQDREAEDHRRRLENKASLAGKYAALAILAQDAGLKDEDRVSVPYVGTVHELKQFAAVPGMIPDHRADTPEVWGRWTTVKELSETADQLKVSCDFLLGRTPEPAINTGEAKPETVSTEPAGWRTGEPEFDGTYLVWSSFLGYKPDYELMRWKQGRWSGLTKDERIFAWAPVPEPFQAEEEDVSDEQLGKE